MLTPLPHRPGVCELQRQTQRSSPPVRLPKGQHYTHLCQPLRYALQLSRPVATPRYVFPHGYFFVAHSQPYAIHYLICTVFFFYSTFHTQQWCFV